jgi:nitroimidazol reductase NimA-like FMN-containing flavoprotein (pyridoxamine 5'-phosphate oxidase superfamily)
MELKERISSFLKTVNVCVLCTSNGDIPRGTPIEFYSSGIKKIYMIGGTGTKIDNIRANRKVNVSIYNTPYTDWTDWYRVVGVQISGQASLITDENKEYWEALEIYKWQYYAKARGVDIEKVNKRGRLFIKVVPEKIEYRELALLAKGFSATQVLECSDI